MSQENVEIVRRYLEEPPLEAVGEALDLKVEQSGRKRRTAANRRKPRVSLIIRRSEVRILPGPLENVPSFRAVPRRFVTQPVRSPAARLP